MRCTLHTQPAPHTTQLRHAPRTHPRARHASHAACTRRRRRCRCCRRPALSAGPNAPPNTHHQLSPLSPPSPAQAAGGHRRPGTGLFVMVAPRTQPRAVYHCNTDTDILVFEPERQRPLRWWARLRFPPPLLSPVLSQRQTFFFTDLFFLATATHSTPSSPLPSPDPLHPPSFSDTLHHHYY